MQIVEVKNSIAKVFYNPAENNILPSDFILIDDNSQKVIAQVIDIETTENFKNTYAIVRLALYIDKEENLSYYNGYIPSKHSKLYYINPDEIIELIKDSKNNIYFGNLSNHTDSFVKTGFPIIDEKLYIQSDKSDKTAIVVKNLISELNRYNKKSILLDFNGLYSDLKNAVKLKISDNLKLPLNVHAFDTILEYDITDCPIQDRALIQSIVLELREYLKTVKQEYIPFNTFKTVVDSEFTSNPVSGLMLLRNKLWFYSQENIFADYRNQFDFIDDIFKKENTILIDASDISEKWYKLIIKTIAELVNQDCYLFVSLNDVDIDKKSVLKLYNKKNITPIISTLFESPYKNLLKSICHNQLLLKPSVYQNEREYYCSIINKMNTDEFILFGETTLYLPLLMELKLFDADTAENVIENDIKKDVDKFLSPKNNVISKFASEETQEDITKKEDPEEFLDSDFDYLDELEKVETVSKKLKEEANEPIAEEKEIKEENNNDMWIEGDGFGYPLNEEEYEKYKKEMETQREKEEIEEVKEETQIVENTEQTNKDELQEINEEKEEANIVENTEQTNKDELQEINEEKEETQIVENTEQTHEDEYREVNETKEETDIVEKNEQSFEDEIHENSDENSTEEMTSIDEVISKIEDTIPYEEEDKENQEELNEPLTYETEEVNETKESIEINEDAVPKPIKEIPVYETHTEQTNLTKENPFKVGDKVYHPKHGKGVIEGFANYSNKILFCQINFEHVGRRILDPAVSGLEKIS